MAEAIMTGVARGEFGEERGFIHGLQADSELADGATFDTLSLPLEASAPADLDAVPSEFGELPSIVHAGGGLAGALHISSDWAGSDGANSLWLQYDHDSGQMWLNIDCDGDMNADLTFDVSDHFATLLGDLQGAQSEPPAW